MKKNYIILIVLLLSTVLITLLFSRMYLNRSKEVSVFYEESNKITAKELEETSLEEKNLLNKLVYVDTNKSLIKKFKDLYKLNIKIDKYPIIVFVVDKKVIKTIYINDNQDIDSYIDYGVYE